MSDGLQDAGIQLAETLQTAHINHNPDPTRDFAPQTSVDRKVPVRFDRSREASSDVDDVGEDEVPLSVLRPLPEEPWAPRHMQLPDLRFEQSYLKSISDAKDWKVVTYITIKDQVLMPLVQGLVWTLAVSWWRKINAGAHFSGQTMGAKVRRWWWGVNNWKIPDDSKWRPTRK